MDRIALKAQSREILGKKVRKLRKDGLIPAHVFGNKVQTENICVFISEFLGVYQKAGETGLIDLRIGEAKVRPVLIREVQLDPVRGNPLHIDFYQVNLKKEVRVFVPIVQVGEEPEAVHSGEAVVIQPINEVEVSALPTDLPEHLAVDISRLKEIDDALTVADLPVLQGVTILAEGEAVVVKLDTAVTEEMEKLLEEQAAEAAAAAETAEAKLDLAEAKEGEAPAEEGEKEGAEEAPEEASQQGESTTEPTESTAEKEE